MAPPVKIDCLLLDRVLARKLCGNLCKVRNNNNNILQIIRKVCQLYTRCMAPLAIGGPVTGEVQYDQMPIGLLDRLQCISFFANKVTDEIIYEETEILEKTIPRLFEVMQRVVKFTCEYV